MEELLANTLHEFAKEEKTSKEFRAHMEFLLKIHRNIYENQEDQKFRFLKLSNKSLNEILGYANANEFLKLIGWEKIDDPVLLDTANVHTALEILLEYRLIAPSSKEWVEETKVECLTSAEEREKKKRAEAAKERDKEYRECIADQLERKQLGERIRELIHIQNKERRQLHEEKQKQLMDIKKQKQEDVNDKGADNRQVNKKHPLQPKHPLQSDSMLSE